MYKIIHLQTWHSPDGCALDQIDHCMIDERKFSHIIDVRAQRGENIDLNHILVVVTLRTKLCKAYTTRQEQQRRRLAVERLKSEDVATQYRCKWCPSFEVRLTFKHAALINFGMELKKK
jgi:hypothetical protein